MRIIASGLCFLLILGSTNIIDDSGNSEIKINQIQVLGSHNSFKEAIQPELLELLRAATNRNFEGLEYEHIPLSQQLDAGLRKLELDIYHDPQGGRFAEPYGNKLLADAGKEALPYDPQGLMNTPGFKVMHGQDIDFRSNCLRLIDCLEELKIWSDQHPNHLPITISFNTKTSSPNRPGFTNALPYTPQAFDSLDLNILSVIPKERIITPDLVKGDFETLEAAVLAKNWPLISESRGKFLFVLNDKNKQRQLNYRQGHPSLEGRVMFIEAAPGEPEAAFLFLNNPIKQQDSIRKMVKLGYLIRTRADSGTKEARKGDYTRFEAALTSGAQFISTDYYLPNEEFATGYQIKFPGGEVAICNPINAKNESTCNIVE